jgi:biotin carboxyl carrier protein
VRYDVEINGRTRQVAISRAGEGYAAIVDGLSFQVGAARIDAVTLSLLVQREGGPSRIFDVTIVPDPASGQLAVHVGETTMTVGLNGRRLSGGRDEGGDAGTGPQRVLAPMPGKIVRVLVQSGEAVRARQPLVVVEAMKMENELRAPRAGTILEIRCAEGEAVEAGQDLIVVETTPG